MLTNSYGLPPPQWLSNETVLDVYRDRPNYFTADENAQLSPRWSTSERISR